MGRLSFWKRLNLMLWKNWNVQLHHWRHAIFCLCMPFFFSLLLIVLRCLVKTQEVGVTKYQPYDLQTSWRELMEKFEERSSKLKHLKKNAFIPRIAIAYAPNVSDYVNAIMMKADTDYLDNVAMISFKTISELTEAMMSEHYIVGVKFTVKNETYNEHEDDEVESVYPHSLSFSLMFPSELRFWNSFSTVGSNWHTYELYDSLSEEKHRNPQDKDGGFVGYIREGFTAVQNAISMAYISLRAPDNTLPTVKLHRFPRIPGTNDPLIQSLRYNVSFAIIFGFLYPCLYITLTYNKEKECNFVEFLHIMGINHTVQIIAWFINSFVVLFITALFFIAALKINWNNGFAILNNSSWLALLCLMIAYILASISFTFMVSSFFVRRSTATLVLVLVWMLTYSPALMMAITESPTAAVLICVFSNCCMSLALNQMLKFESVGNGFLWSSYFDHHTSNSPLTNGVLTIFLLLLSIIYIIIALCMLHWRAGFLETTKRIERMACFQAIRRLSKRWSDDSPSSSTVLRNKRMSKVYEVNPGFQRTYVEIKGLYKIYKDTAAVKDFNMKLFTGEIMVLLGQNGCGKSTLLSIIAGMLKPTKGTVLIDGINAREHFETAFSVMGYSSQEKILISELSVQNQIIFHCRLKGLSAEDLEQEVNKYLMALGMHENRHQTSGELGIGLKKYLGVCCALCAESKFVVLDEPDTGMDLLVRRKFRDLLLLEKHDRTILMTTHSTDEADSIADRIAIMASGELKCYGTSNFLRKLYSNGYRLLCVKNERCDSSAVTAAIQKFLPLVRLVPESEIGTELSYRLDHKYLAVFPSILDHLEENLSELKIISVSIGESSIDDVFFSMGTDNPFGVDRSKLTDALNGVSTSLRDEKNFLFMQKTKNYNGLRLLISQWRALLLKRLIMNFRIRPIVFLQFLMPLLFTAFSFPIGGQKEVRNDLPSMTYRLNQYPESVTVVDVRVENPDGFEQLIIENYMDMISSMGIEHKLIETGNLGFNEFMLKLEERKLMKRANYVKYLVGASFIKQEFRACFNNYPLHTVPLTLNLMHNAILRAAINDSVAGIVVTLEPLPFMTDLANDLYNDAGVGGLMGINLTFCVGLFWSTSVMSLVKERKNNFKMIQYIHGARPSTYWQSMFIYDSINIIVVSIIIMLVILCFQHYVFINFGLQVEYFFTLVVFGTLMLPFNYVLSYIFVDHITAFCVIAFFSLYSGVTYSTFMNVLERDYTDSEHLAKIVQWLMRTIPHLSICNTLARLYSYEKVRMLCSDNIYNSLAKLSKYNLDCDKKPYCCKEKQMWSWPDGVLPELVAIVTVFVCSTIVLIIIELRNVHKAGLFNKVIPKDNVKAAKEDYEQWNDRFNRSKEESREKERIRVLTLKPKDQMEKALIMKSVGKLHNRKEDFHRIFLVLNHYECFALFGSSTSGKTAFIKMLVENNASSYGEIFVNGLSLRQNLYEIYDKISYCPQFSAHVDDFSGFEVMKIYCMLHGIPRNEINPICENLARAFGFMPHLRKLIKFYSPGTKRRFRTSLALLGNPSVIYLDDPMMGIDLASLRQLCHIICELRKTGTAVLFTSLSYKWTGIICSRMAFLANGRLSHIGPMYDAHGEPHYKGYLVKLKLKKVHLELSGIRLGSTESLFMPNPFLKVQSFVEVTFANAVMKDQRGNIMYFFIPSKNMKMSHIFNTLHQNSFILDIETFFVTDDTVSLFICEIIEKNTPVRSLSRVQF